MSIASPQNELPVYRRTALALPLLHPMEERAGERRDMV